MLSQFRKLPISWPTQRGFHGFGRALSHIVQILEQSISPVYPPRGCRLASPDKPDEPDAPDAGVGARRTCATWTGVGFVECVGLKGAIFGGQVTIAGVAGIHN